jgi:uncharacterized protein
VSRKLWSPKKTSPISADDGEYVSFLCSGRYCARIFGPESDIGVLVEFAPEAVVELFDFARMQEELEKMFGRDVDLVSRRGVEAGRNYLRRKAIMETAEVMYAER